MTEELAKRFFENFGGADGWVALGFVVAGILWWVWIGTRRRQERKILARQLLGLIILGVLFASVLVLKHRVFQNELPFDKQTTGVLVMQIAGDEQGALQGHLVDSFNEELHRQSGLVSVEVRAGRELIDTNNGLPSAHDRARQVGTRLNAKFVVWGRAGVANRLHPHITVIATPIQIGELITAAGGAINEIDLPDELATEPFYLNHFVAGCCHYARAEYLDALPQFKAALEIKPLPPPRQLTDLQAYIASCDLAISDSDPDDEPHLKEAIALFEQSASTYKTSDVRKWAICQVNLGVGYSSLKTGSRDANVKMSVACTGKAGEIFTASRYPDEWAMIQNNLGQIMVEALGDQIEAMMQNNPGLTVVEASRDQIDGLTKAISIFQSALEHINEKKSPQMYGLLNINLGNAYALLPGEFNTVNLPLAVAAYSNALRVLNERQSPRWWALAQVKLGYAYSQLPNGNRTDNLRRAKAALEAGMKLLNEPRHPEMYSVALQTLSDVTSELENSSVEP